MTAYGKATLFSMLLAAFAPAIRAQDVDVGDWLNAAQSDTNPQWYDPGSERPRGGVDYEYRRGDFGQDDQYEYGDEDEIYTYEYDGYDFAEDGLSLYWDTYDDYDYYDDYGYFVEGLDPLDESRLPYQYDYDNDYELYDSWQYGLTPEPFDEYPSQVYEQYYEDDSYDDYPGPYDPYWAEDEYFYEGAELFDEYSDPAQDGRGHSPSSQQMHDRAFRDYDYGRNR